MAYRMNTGNCYYEDGYLSNEYHGAFHRGGFQNRYSGNFNYGYNNNACAFQNRVTSHQEVDEPSLKDLMKSVIRTQAKTDEALENQFEALENQLKELNEKIDQDDRSYQAWLQDMELKFDQMEERFSNELTGQPIQNTQQNPSPHGKSSWYCEEDYYSEDEDGISPRFNESGLDAGRNEQQNENPAELDMTASQSTDPLRRSEASDCSPWGFQYPSASQSSPMRSSEYAESEGVVEFCLDDFDEVKYEPEVEIEVEELKRAEKIIEHPEIKAYTIEFEDDDSEDEDWFEELNELTVKDNVEENVGKIEREELEVGLNGLETVSPMNVEVEFDLDKELQESIGEVEGEGVELLDIDVNNIKSENLEECEDEKEDVDGMTTEEFGKWLDNELDGLETVSPMEVNLDFDFDEDMKFFEALDRENLVKNGLKCLETVFPNKVNENSMVKEEFEVKKKPPDLSKLQVQGMHDFINKLISLLSCRKEESLEKVGMASFHERKKKCNKFCIHVDYSRRVMIFASTKQWFDAWVKYSYGLFVVNEAIMFYDVMFVCNYRDGRN